MAVIVQNVLRVQIIFHSTGLNCIKQTHWPHKPSVICKVAFTAGTFEDVDFQVFTLLVVSGKVRKVNTELG